jgi:hypothetical protein
MDMSLVDLRAALTVDLLVYLKVELLVGRLVERLVAYLAVEKAELWVVPME